MRLSFCFPRSGRGEGGLSKTSSGKINYRICVSAKKIRSPKNKRCLPPSEHNNTIYNMRRKLRQKEEWNLEYCISDCLPMSILCRAPLANESSLGEVKTHMDVRENCHFVQFATLSGVTFCKKYRKIQEREREYKE